MITKPYKSSNDGKKKQIAMMFDNIAKKYDFLNHFLSFGIDRIWRRSAIEIIKAVKPDSILDVATGTADFAIEACQTGAKRIVGIDISEGMLKAGKEKIEKAGLSNTIELVRGDSENISFNDSSFDVVMVAFGVRNFENPERGLTEMNRVLKDKGLVCILEFSKPQKFPMKQLFHLYSYYVLPFLGKVLSKDSSAYSYLPESVNKFPYGTDFIKIVENTGFKEVKQKLLTYGIATIYYGKK